MQKRSTKNAESMALNQAIQREMKMITLHLLFINLSAAKASFARNSLSLYLSLSAHLEVFFHVSHFHRALVCLLVRFIICLEWALGCPVRHSTRLALVQLRWICCFTFCFCFSWRLPTFFRFSLWFFTRYFRCQHTYSLSALLIIYFSSFNNFLHAIEWAVEQIM